MKTNFLMIAKYGRFSRLGCLLFVYYFMDEEKVMNEKEKVNQITEGVIWKQLLLFFFPIVFGTFFQQIYNTADTIVVGRFVGKQALAAVGGSASQIANLIVGFL